MTERRWDTACRSRWGPTSSERFTAYVRPGGREPDITIRLFDASGRRVGGASQETAMPQPPDSLMPG